MTDTTYDAHISRYFDAPPSAVYRAFVEPEQLAQWFGPLVMHCPVETIEVDARPGGIWKMTMVNNDNPEWQSPLNSTIVEVIENELLVGYELAKDFPGMEDGTKITMTVEFRPEGEGTRLELRQGPFTEQMSELSTVGWGQSFHKLDGLLATPAKYRPGGGA